jgi:preprotein translocase subunit SecG
MYAFLSFIHVSTCALLIVSVLLQSSKGGGLAGAFGGQSTQAVFGGRGAGTFLSRATTVLAIIFMLTSLAMTLQGGGRSRKSALAEQAEKEGVAAPFVPAQPPAEGAEGVPGTEGAPQGVPQPPQGAQGADGQQPPLGSDAVPQTAPGQQIPPPPN